MQMCRNSLYVSLKNHMLGSNNKNVFSVGKWGSRKMAGMICTISTD